jgi:hypothetical protein
MFCIQKAEKINLKEVIKNNDLQFYKPCRNTNKNKQLGTAISINQTFDNTSSE